MTDLKQRVATLSAHVSDVFGGTVESAAFVSGVESAIAALVTKSGNQSVSLGALIRLGRGVCRHRSILFKYLCDHMHRFPEQWRPTNAADGSGPVRGIIPCQLVRGVQSALDGSGSAEGHMWNVVRLSDELFIVDVFQRPGKLLSADSKEAQAYQRVILASTANGAPAPVRVLLYAQRAI